MLDRKSEDWQFGSYSFNAATGVLFKGEQTITLLPKDCTVLEVLLARSCHLVSKDELYRHCWPQQAVVGGDVLKTCIRRLRKTLGDDYRTPVYIETVGRRGYRFLLPARHSLPLKTASASPHSAPDFVGRDKELSELCNLLSVVESGCFHLVVISGEAGIGKTTLISNFLNGLSDRQETLLLQGHCLNCHGPAEAYHPLLACMEQLAGKLGQQTLAGLLRRLAPMWLVQLPWLIDSTERQLLQTELQGVSGQRMQRELLALATELSHRYTQVVVIEDMHWSDHATVDLLQRFASLQPPPQRLLLIATSRSGENLNHPFHGVLDHMRGKSMCRHIFLQSLPAPAILAYLTARFSGLQIPDGLADWLQSHSGGNPLLFKAMIEQGLNREWLLETDDKLLWRIPVPGNATQLAPRHIRYLIDSRLNQLPSEERDCLETASACGLSFPVRLLADSAGHDKASELLCEQLSRCTSYLRRSKALALGTGEKNPCFSFRHALYQQVVHDGMPSLRRQQLHQAVARRLAAMFPEPPVDVSLQLAQHYEQGGEYLAAAAHRQRVAVASLQRHAYRETIDHARKGLSSLRELPENSDKDTQELAILLPLGASYLATKGYAAPSVEMVYSRAQQLLVRSVSQDCQLTVLCSLAIYRLAKAELAKVQESADALHLYAEQTQKATDMVGALSLATLHAFYRGDPLSAISLQQQCWELYAPAYQRKTYLEVAFEPGITALAHAAMSSWLAGYPRRAMEEIGLALTIARDHSSPFMQIWCLCYQGWLHVYQEELERGQQCAEEARRLSLANGIEYYLAQSSIMLGWLEGASGNYDSGIALIEQNLQAHRQTGAKLICGFFLYLLADVLRRANRPEQALAKIEASIAHSARTGEAWWLAEMHRLRGVLLLSLADSDGDSSRQERLLAVEKSYTSALTTARDQQAKMLELRAASSMAELRLRQGRAAEGLALLEPVYRWFSEGHETRDLRVAKQFLEDSGAPGSR